MQKRRCAQLPSLQRILTHLWANNWEAPQRPGFPRFFEMILICGYLFSSSFVYSVLVAACWRCCTNLYAPNTIRSTNALVASLTPPIGNSGKYFAETIRAKPSNSIDNEKYMSNTPSALRFFWITMSFALGKRVIGWIRMGLELIV